MQLVFCTVSGTRTHIDFDKKQLTAYEVKALVAQRLTLPLERLKLVYKGQAVSEKVLTTLKDGDSVLVVVVPKAPSQELRSYVDQYSLAENDEFDRFRLPANAPQWQRNLVQFLQQRMKIPEVVLLLVFSLRRKVWLSIIFWIVGAKVATIYEVGPLFLVASVFLVILLNLGRRQEGEASAYSIFNNHQRLPGQLTAEHMDDQLRRGNLG